MSRSSKKIRARKKGARWFRRKTKKLLAGGALVTAIVAAALGSPLASVITNGIGLAESNLVYSGGLPKTPVFEVKSLATAGHILHVTLRPVFKNWSLKGGHIAKITIAPDGLNDVPERVEIISVDRSEIGWFQEKEIRCELLVVVNPTTIGFQRSRLRFRIYFYGPKGNQLYWEGVTVEGWRQAATA